jgi:O-antigen biosynthesis protein
MNILFLTSAAPEKAAFSTNEKRPPLGLGFLMAVLKKKGHNIFFSDEYLQPSRILDSDFLKIHKIDYVGIYSNTICYKSTLDMFNKLQNKRKDGSWTGEIMVGGPHTSIDCSEIPDFVDHIVIGEGEISVPKIVSGEIKERIVRGEKVVDLDSLPIPSWEEFIYRPYQWKHDWLDTYPMYTMNTSRGCPFNCTFCSVNAIWGRTYRCMSALRVVEEIEYLTKYYGAKAIYFREDHFTLKKERTVEFCELLLKKNIKIDWMCETRVDQLDDYEYQKLMKEAGCKVFYIGVESGSPRMLEFFKKGETIQQFIKAFETAHKVGIKTYASFVVAAPTETQKDRDMTDHLIQQVQPDFVGKNIYVGLPGSELYSYIKNNNLYEYEDEFHLLYPLGYLENVKRFYNDDEYYKTYTLSKVGSTQKVSTCVGDKIKKSIKKYLSKVA